MELESITSRDVENSVESIKSHRRQDLGNQAPEKTTCEVKVRQRSDGKRSVGSSNENPTAANQTVLNFDLGDQVAPLLALTGGQRVLRSLLFRTLNRLGNCRLCVVDADGQHLLGGSHQGATVPKLITVRIANPVAYKKIVFAGDLGFADALVDGDWTTDDLTSLVRLFVQNMKLTDEVGSRSWSNRRLFSKVKHWLQRNTKSNAKRNIHAHYDLSNAFFELWLDPTMSYSSGVFPTLNSTAIGANSNLRSPNTMQEASVGKLNRVCRKLGLKSTDHLVEIGCGWGGLAIHAVKNFGCRVTGITLSKEQLDFARARVEKEGLTDRIDLRLVDYRDLEGSFDKLVSIEMIEAVGHQFFDSYFAKCCQLLKPNGRMVLQSITIGESRFQSYLRKVDFIREYIFPGGCLPSVNAVMNSVAKVTDFRMTHLEDIGLHYAETLRRWRIMFHQQLPQIRQLGFDQRFARMWDYYLAYCEAAFDEGHVGTVQMVLDRPHRVADSIALSRRLSDRK